MKNFTRIPNLLTRSPTVTASAKALYLAIASCSPSFAGYRRLSQWTGLSQATIAKALKELVALGIVTYDKGSTRGRANLYHVQPEGRWKLPASFSEAPATDNRFNIRSGPATDSKAPPLQSLALNKTNEERTNQKDQLSQEPEKIRDYFKTLKPAGKRRSERQHFQTLREDYSDKEIAECLERLVLQGLNGEPCHSPMAYLSKAMPQILQEASQEQEKRIARKNREQRKMEEEQARQLADARAEQEDLMISEAFNSEFPSPAQQRERVHAFAIGGANMIPEQIRAGLAKREWWESLTREEREKFKGAK